MLKIGDNLIWYGTLTLTLNNVDSPFNVYFIKWTALPGGGKGLNAFLPEIMLEDLHNGFNWKY